MTNKDQENQWKIYHDEINPPGKPGYMRADLDQDDFNAGYDSRNKEIESLKQENARLRDQIMALSKMALERGE